jgi:hypothetical protein
MSFPQVAPGRTGAGIRKDITIHKEAATKDKGTGCLFICLDEILFVRRRITRLKGGYSGMRRIFHTKRPPDARGRQMRKALTVMPSGLAGCG